MNVPKWYVDQQTSSGNYWTKSGSNLISESGITGIVVTNDGFDEGFLINPGGMLLYSDSIQQAYFGQDAINIGNSGSGYISISNGQLSTHPNIIFIAIDNLGCDVL